MARTIYQYKPFIDPSSTAVGIKLPFNQAAVGKDDRSATVGNVSSGSFQTTSGKGVFSLSYTTEDQAISNLTNLLLTRKGERFLRLSGPAGQHAQGGVVAGRSRLKC